MIYKQVLWKIGDFQFNRLTGKLQRIGATNGSDLGNNEMRLLEFFVDNFGQKLTNDKTTSEVWSDTVGPNSLSKSVQLLRDSFAGRRGEYIRARPYRLVKKPIAVDEEIAKNDSQGRISLNRTDDTRRLTLHDEKVKTSAKPEDLSGFRKIEPSLSTLAEIAGDRMKMHTRDALSVSLRHYKEIKRKFGPNEEASGEIAKAYLNLGHTGFCDMLPQVSIPLLRDEIAEALKDFPDMPAAYAFRGLSYVIYDHDWIRGYTDLNHALALNPNLAWAHCFISHLDVAQGKFEEGLQHARCGAKLDPATAMTVFTIPFMLVFAGRANEAVPEAAQYVQDFDPFPIGHILYGYALEAIGATRRAIDEYKRSLEMEFFPDALARLGHAYGILGEQKTALAYLKKLKEAEAHGIIAYLPGYLEALIHVGLGDYEQTFKCLENSFAQKCDWLIYLNVEPCWTPLKRYKRFEALLQRVGLAAKTALS
jgi:tetratricopeptide (TPR) repeat protein/DNA-binding winged helix-turn-helix (wHTH) protein